MASELPKAPHRYGEGKVPPWKKDASVRKNRDRLVPDTVEWSGQRPRTGGWRREPIEFVSPNGWELKLPCWDMPHGRVIGTSSCTGLETPIMPFGDHAWAFLEIVEAAADEFLSAGWQVSRADFARDIRIYDARDYLKHHLSRVAQSGLEVEVHLKERQAGATYLGVAGGDRLRIYHKGLETAKKFKLMRPPDSLMDVIRVELQLRKGQLDEKLRKNVAALRTGRVERAPSEDDVPVMGRKPDPRHGIRRRHLWGMKRERHPRRVDEATEAVDRFLLEQGFDQLLPDAFGTELPEPDYGAIPADRQRR